ncbi:Cytochrome bo(3) ubiquinol oxidase subunit 1 [compost metagenome]
MIICAGIGLQLLQLVVSIVQRKKNRDSTGDPWNGRTLEWSVPSPAPFYNFAVTPIVHTRDQFWEEKQALLRHERIEKPAYQDIYLPKSSPLGPIIAAFAFLIGFGLIWHMWWLAGVGLLAVIICIIIRTSNDDTEYLLSAKQLEKLDRKHIMKEQYS